MNDDIAVKLLRENLGKAIMLKLKGEKRLRGKLAGFDGHMNLVLKEAEELIGDSTRSYSMLLIRGGNILFVAPISS